MTSLLKQEIYFFPAFKLFNFRKSICCFDLPTFYKYPDNMPDYDSSDNY